MQRRFAFAIAAVAVAATVACQNNSVPSGLGSQQISLSADTVAGSASLAELQQKRAAWVARGINDYRVQLQITCFCGGEIRRPVLVEVRRGAVAKVWDLETAKEVADKSPYPTVTALFDRAIEERTRGPNVEVAYDRELGYPARLTIGTLANDAGTYYTLGALKPL